MANKAILVLCASVLLIKTISGQCISRPVNTGCGSSLGGNGGGLNLAGNNLIGSNAGYGSAGGYAGNLGNIASSSGGELLVYSSSAFAPSGLSVASENSLEGALNVIGSLPFLSAVALEGGVASGGSAGVSYGCGSGNVGITGLNGGSASGGSGYGAGLASSGLAGAGLNNIGLSGGRGTGGCGCNALY